MGKYSIPVEITIDHSRCVGCRRCTMVCIDSVYEWDDEAGGAVAKHPEDCISCCQCEWHCLGNCITVRTKEGQYFDALADVYAKAGL